MAPPAVFGFSMEIYGDDDDTTAIQDQQHKVKLIHFFLRCEDLFPENWKKTIKIQ